MLFSFNLFWKVTFTIIGFWLIYLLFGYEFTIVTLLSVIIAQGFSKVEK